MRTLVHRSYSRKQIKGQAKSVHKTAIFDEKTTTPCGDLPQMCCSRWSAVPDPSVAGRCTGSLGKELII